MIPFFDESQEIVISFSPVVRERFMKIQQTREIFQLLQTNPSISLSSLQKRFGVSRSLASKRKKQLAENNGSVEEAIASSSPYKTNKTVLGLDNEMEIATALDNCVALDIPVTFSELSQVMRLTARRRNRSSQMIPQNYPSYNTVRKFMTDYGFSLLKGHLMSTNFERGERIEKVASYANLWLKLFSQHPETKNTMCIFNLDETLLDLSKGQESSFIVRKGSYSGVKRSSFKGERFTIVVITCADGSVIPPILVIPHYPKSARDRQILNELCPEGATIMVNKSTCTTHKMLIEYIQHFNKHVRTRISQEKKVVLVVDGHPSRESRDKTWVQKAEELNIIIIVSPSCTSHYLQPNDQLVNRQIKQTVRAAVDLSKKVINGFDQLSVLQQQLAVCRQAIQSLTHGVVTDSWHETLITPLEFETFVERWKKKWAKFRIQASVLLGDSVYESGITSDRERNLLVEMVQEQESRQAQNTEASANGSTNGLTRDSFSASNQQMSSVRTYATDADIVGSFLANLETVTGLPVMRAYARVDSASKSSIIGSMAQCGIRLSDAIVKTMGRRKRRYSLKPGQDLVGGPRILNFSQLTPEANGSAAPETRNDGVVEPRESAGPTEPSIAPPLRRKRAADSSHRRAALKRPKRGFCNRDLNSSTSDAEHGEPPSLSRLASSLAPKKNFLVKWFARFIDLIKIGLRVMIFRVYLALRPSIDIEDAILASS